jgi:thioredoxin 1
MEKERVQEISEKDFSKIINSKKENLVIIDFFAEWCMPCVMMAPVFARLAEKYSQVKFAKINVDDAPKLSQEYEISSIPCIVFFKDGEEVDRIIGGVNEDVLIEKIQDYLRL